MKSNWTVRSNTPITEYAVDSKGIRHIRTIIPGKKPKDDRKPGADEPKPRNGDDKPDKPE